ncbi:MAG: DNA primase [Gemmatimonadetes bacterium]|nr:DNA primase [Gemmatimonadota bacterium]
MIPDEDVERVREAADIVAIIGEHVRLKRVGSVYRGPCPFHQGTNNNFSVMPRGGYTCFVCGEKGNVFTFVQKRLGMTFVEAVKFVGEKVGIEVREITKQREGPDPREPLWEINATAAAWFTARLWDDERGKEAREYLASRAISRETADEWEMGFAPRELGLLRAHMATLGWEPERLLEAGLLAKREEEEEPRPRFRDRLMFAILDQSSRHVGFGGRLMGPGEPKYLNSADTPAFHKGQTLYGLHKARAAMRREDRAILVEGYFDAIRMASAGVEGVVAPLGTSLTEGQAELLRRHAKTVFIAYDSDGPGQKATFRAADVLLAQGVAVRVVTMPEGDDPDTYVRAHGRDAMEKLIAGALDVFDRKVQLLERGGWFADLQRKRRALDALLPTIRAAKDPITREMYLARAAEAAKVDRGVLARELDAPSSRRGRVGTASPAARKAPAPDDAETAAPRSPAPVGPYKSGVEASSSEHDLVRVMVLHRALAELVIEGVGRLSEDEAERPDWLPEDDDSGRAPAGLRDPVYREMYEALLDADPALHGGALVEWLAERLEPWVVRIAEEMLDTPESMVNPQATVDGALRRLRERSMRDRLAELDRVTPLATGEQKDRLIAEKQRLHNELRHMGATGWKGYRRA